MSNNRKFKSAFSFLIALIMIMQVITPVIAEGIQSNKGIQELEKDQGGEAQKPQGNLEGEFENSEGEFENSEGEFEKTEEDSEGEFQEPGDSLEEDQKPEGNQELEERKELGDEESKKVDYNDSDIEESIGEGRDLKQLDDNYIKYNVKLYAGEEDISHSDEINISEIDNIQYHIEFTKIDDDFNFQVGDYLKFDVSQLSNLKGLNIENLKEAEKLIFINTNNSESLIVGEYFLDNEGQFVIKFTDVERLNQLKSRKLEAGLLFEIDKEYKSDVIIEEIILEGFENKSFVIRRNGENKGDINKIGEYNLQDDTIVWTIDVNTNLADLKDVIIEDLLPKGLTVENIMIGDVGMQNFEDINFEISGNTVKIALNDLGRKSKSIKIITSLSHELIGDISVTNKAILKSGETTIDESENSVNLSNRVSSLSKDGILNGNTITWKISFRGNDEDINEIIKDTITIPDNLKDKILLEIEDVKLIKENKEEVILNIQKDNEEKPVEYYKILDNNEDGSVKTIEFNILSSKNLQTIEYKTNIIYLDKEEINNFSINNRAEYNEKEASYYISNINRNNFNSKSVAENQPIVDKENVYLDWNIVINEKNEKWKNVEIVDTIPEGFEFVEVLNKTDEMYVSSSEDKKIVTIEFNKIESKRIVKIRTKLIDTSIFDNNGEMIKNTATINWDVNLPGKEGIVGGNYPGDNDGTKNEYTVSKEVSKEIFESKISKENKGINYKEGKLNWKVNFNTIKEKINKDFKITDELEGQHKYDKNSFKLLINDKEYSLNENNSNEDNPNKCSIMFKDDDKSFEITISDGIESNDTVNTIILTYDTKFDLKTIDDIDEAIEFKNNIKIINNNKHHTDSKEINIKKEVANNGNKTGIYSGEGRIFNWEARLNYKGKNIKKNQEIIDKLFENHVYKDKTLVINKAELKEDGSLEVLEELEITKDYNVSFNDNYDKMEITFTSDLNHPVIIKYSTEAKEVSKENYINKIKYNGIDYNAEAKYNKWNDYLDKKSLVGKDEYVYKGDKIKWKIVINSALSELKEFKLIDELGEGHILLLDSLKISNFKNNSENPFEVTLSENKILLEAGIIEDEYIIEYETLVVSDKNLKEISNKVSLESTDLEKHIIETEKQTITGKKYAKGSGIYDDSNNYKLIIRKVDSKNDLITSSEATFELITKINANGKEYVDIETIETENSEIEILLEKNDLRRYFIKEVKSPDGYIKSEEEFEIVLDNINDEKEILIEVVNYKSEEVTEVTAKKVWIGGPKEKPEIEIQLFKNGEKFGEPVKLKDKTEHTFKNLVIRDEGMDKDNIYTVDEVEVPRYYRKSISEDGLTITNTYNYIPSTEDPEDPDDRPYYPENEEKVEKSKKPKTEENNELIKPGSKLPPIIEDNTQAFESNKSKNPGTENNISKQPVNNIKELLPRTGIEGFNYIMILGFILLVFGVINLKKED